MKNDIAIILLAAGFGNRFEGIIPKQFVQIASGVNLWQSAYEMFRANLPDARIIIVGSKQHQHLWNLSSLDANYQWVEGGEMRADSVRAGIAALQNKPPHMVLVHDAARPFVPITMLNELIKTLENGAKAAIPAIPIADTIKQISHDEVAQTIPRDGLFAAQTPQAFCYATLAQLIATNENSALTDDALLFEQNGIPVKIVQGDVVAFKVTTAQDIEFARFYYAKINDKPIATTQTISAMGYDVHRFALATHNQQIRLGGIDIAHELQLSGHSDADVVLHAITDALLGLCAAGDIGEHFPPSNQEYAGLDSAIFLRHTAQILAARGGVLAHLDITIICEAPKIAPHRAAMQHKIAEILAISPNKVSVKATTTEGLGFCGRREGIAAQAIATANMPIA